MTADLRYRSLLFLFGFVVACTIVSVARWLMNGLMPFWAICCYAMSMDAKTPGPVGLAVIAVLLFGFVRLVSRLWKTRQFVFQLNSAAMTVPPVRLARIFSELGLSQRTAVLATGMPLAFCSGLLRPRICLSLGLADALNDAELKAVLLHEDHHRRHFDPLRGLLVEIITTLLFFLPVAAELRDSFLTSMELEADQHAVRLAGRASLAGALRKFLTHPLTVRLPAIGLAGLSATEARVAALLGDSPAFLRLSTHRLAASSVILMLVCVLA